MRERTLDRTYSAKVFKLYKKRGLQRERQPDALSREFTLRGGGNHFGIAARMIGLAFDHTEFFTRNDPNTTAFTPDPNIDTVVATFAAVFADNLDGGLSLCR